MRIVGLVDDPDRGAAECGPSTLRQPGDIGAADDDVASAGRRQPTHQAEQRALARARAAGDRDKLTRLHAELRAPQRDGLDVAVFIDFVEVVQGDKRFH